MITPTGNFDSYDLSSNDLLIIEEARHDMFEKLSNLDDKICEIYLINEEIPTMENIKEAILTGYTNSSKIV